MKTNDTHESVSRITGRGFVLVRLLAVALAASCFAQSNAAAVAKTADAKTPQPSGNSLTARAAKAPRGMGEGIQMRGWWTIEIRNRDGSVATHVEFENSLQLNGPAILAGLLSGNLVAGSWGIDAYGSPSPCSTSSLGSCFIVQGGAAGINLLATPPCTTTVGPASSTTPQPFCYETLVPSLTGGASAGSSFAYNSFTLSGQAYVDTTTTIASVGTWFIACGPFSATVLPNASAPSQCYGEGQLYFAVPFTQYEFGQTGSCGGSGQPLCEVQVQAGQIISATVTLSFSSPSGDGQSATPALARRHPMLRAPASTKPLAPTPVTQ
jgi:hypothetical protein